MNKIINGDCVSEMKRLLDNSIDLTVTSPPYDNLRDYNGFSFEFEKVANELFRITKKGGVVVWIVGDATKNGNESGTSFKQALYFKKIGFNLHDTMFYFKKGGLNSGSLKAYQQKIEYMFVFSKGTPKSINLIRDRKNIHIEKRKKLKRQKDGTHKKQIVVTKPFGVRYNIWEYQTGKYHSTSDIGALKHPAIFPEKLAEDHIISWSNEGDLVLDPMCGSGTTCKMAKINNRNYIGIDCSEKYCDIARERCSQFHGSGKQ